MRVRYIKHTLNGSDKNPSCHFVEVEALLSNGTNVALNKTCTSDTESTGLSKPVSCITDGDKDKGNYFNVEGKKATITIDLGQVYDVAKIKLYHYGDGRKYRDNIVQASPDGVHYQEMFNSNVDGEYAEVETGKEIVLPNDYKPFVDLSMSGANLIIDVIPNNNTVESVTIGLRGETHDEIMYSGSRITFPVNPYILAYGVNDFEVMVHTTTEVNVASACYRYMHNVSNIGMDTDLKTVSEHIANIANTNQRNREDLGNILVDKGVQVNWNDSLSDLIDKVGAVSSKRWAIKTLNQSYTQGVYTIPLNLEFTPSIVFLECKSAYMRSHTTVISHVRAYNLFVKNGKTFNTIGSNEMPVSATITDISSKGFTLTIPYYDSTFNSNMDVGDVYFFE